MRDVDKMMAAAYQAQTNLEEFVLGDEKVEVISKNLIEVAELASEITDVMLPFLHTSDPAVQIQHWQAMDDQAIADFARRLPADCIHAMLVDVSRKMLEDRFQVSSLSFFLITFRFRPTAMRCMNHSSTLRVLQF